MVAIVFIWISSMASDRQKVLRTGQGCYQEVSWDRGRAVEKHLEEFGQVVLEGPGSIPKARGRGHGSARAPSFEEARLLLFVFPKTLRTHWGP